MSQLLSELDGATPLEPEEMDDLRELQGCIYAFLDHKGVLVLRFTLRGKVSVSNDFITAFAQ